MSGARSERPGAERDASAAAGHAAVSGFGSAAQIRAIVVSEDPQVHAMLSASCDWDLQHPVDSVPRMWDDLVAGRLTNKGVDVVVLATAILDEDLVTAAASMAPWAITVVTCFADPTAALPIRSAVEDSIRTAHDENPAIPVDRVRLIVTAVRDAPEAVRAVQAAAGALLPVAVGQPGHPTVPLAVRQQVSGGEAGRDTPAPVRDPDPSPGIVGPGDADRRPPAVLAVTAGSGGVGGTTVACLLASTMAQGSRLTGRSVRVVLLDLDDRPQCGAPSLVGLEGPGTDLAARRDLAADGSIGHPGTIRWWASPELGIDVVAVPASRSADRDWLAAVLRDVAEELGADVIVVDVPAHLPAPVLDAADRVLVVSSMTRTGLAAAAGRAASCTVDCDALLNRVIPGTGIDIDTAGTLLGGATPIGVLPAAVRDFELVVNHRALHRIHQHDVIAPLLQSVAASLLPEVGLPPGSDAPAVAAPTGSPASGRPTAVPVGTSQPFGRPWAAAAWS